MGIIPVIGKRGSAPSDSTSGKREETVDRVWTFLAGIAAKAIQLTTGAASGYIATSDSSGNVTWGNTLPATSLQFANQTASQTGTIVATAVGEYLVNIYLQCTTAGTSGTIDVTLTYTDDIGATTTAVLATLTYGSTGRASASKVIRCSGGGIDYTFTETAPVGNPRYAVHLNVLKVR